MDLTYGLGEMARFFDVDPDVKNIYIRGKEGGFNWRKCPFDNNSVDLVLFDPPHTVCKWKWIVSRRHGKQLVDKYGYYETQVEAKEDIRLGFDEIVRILKPGGICIFKWSNRRMAHSTVEKLIPSRLPPFQHDISHSGGITISKRYVMVYYYLRKE